MYQCSECGLEVVVLGDGEKIRACNHNCAIIANVSAHASGNSSLKG